MSWEGSPLVQQGLEVFHQPYHAEGQEREDAAEVSRLQPPGSHQECNLDCGSTCDYLLVLIPRLRLWLQEKGLASTLLCRFAHISDSMPSDKQKEAEIRRLHSLRRHTCERGDDNFLSRLLSPSIGHWRRWGWSEPVQWYTIFLIRHHWDGRRV